MTNEDIEQSVDTILSVKTFLESVTPGSAAIKEFEKELKRFCTGLVSQAYEKAAGIAENWGLEDDEPTDPDVAFSCLAAAIRAEKPQPLQASVSP